MNNWSEVSISDIESNKQTYNDLLTKCIEERADNRGMRGSPEIARVCEHIFNWLNRADNDFYIAPASTQYHESFEGGLLIHTLKVYNQIIDLHNLKKFSTVPIESAVFVALTHDWCKINNYETYFKNVKDDNGNWVKQQAYRRIKSSIGLGHGPQSLVMVMQLLNTSAVNLSMDEMAAIRWHMYTYDVSSYDIGDLNICNNTIPLVHMIQFADQLAITEY